MCTVFLVRVNGLLVRGLRKSQVEQFLKGRTVCIREPFLGGDNLLEWDNLLVLNTFSIMGKDIEERV